MFKEEIIPVEVMVKRERISISEDEEPKKLNIEKGLTLRPAFEDNGTVTAFNASKINDGAAALVLVSENKMKELGLTPLVKVTYQISYAQKPEWFTTAPAYAIQNVCKKAGITPDDIDLFEINEAFAVQALSVMKVANLDLNKINVNGGAVALGHPIGASGARILTTLIYALKNRNLKRGLATLCIGGGEASALIIERI
jgi:acetyl-CoA C-acetyltransferase